MVILKMNYEKPDHYLWFINTAKNLINMQLFDAAEDVYNHSLKLFPDEKWLKYHQAHFYLKRKNAHNLLSGFRDDILREFNGDPRSSRLLQDIAIYLGEYGLYFKIASLSTSKESLNLTNIANESCCNYGRNIFSNTFKVFMYWNGDVNDNQSRHLWEYLFGENFKLIGDAEIVNLLNSIDPGLVDIYTKINIPACKSDVARLVWSFFNGGLYVDAHCGVGSIESLKLLATHIESTECIFFAFRSDGVTRVFNSVFYSREGGKIVGFIMKTAFQNLVEQYEKEVNGGFHKYNIFTITGPYLFSKFAKENLIDFSGSECDLPFIYFLDESDLLNLPVARYQFYGYRKAGNHWSERQKSECLFKL
jgi:hypothetical protein